MPHTYDNNELLDMLLLYGECGQIASAASRLYAERFPSRVCPNAKTFIKLLQRARDTGNLRLQREGGAVPRVYKFIKVENNILDFVEKNPTTSSRQIAKLFKVSRNKVCAILRDNELYPFSLEGVQSQKSLDHIERVNFCKWLLQQSKDFCKSVLVMNEASFTLTGVNNFHNTYIWAAKKPETVDGMVPYNRFAVNVWAGIVNGMLIGPVVLSDRMSSKSYLQFLQNDFFDLLEDVPLNIIRNMWFLHDGAAACFSEEVRDFLNNAFPNKWIGQGGPIEWPSGSPDLNPCTYFLWNFMKTLVYRKRISTRVELVAEIESAARTVREKREFLLQACSDLWLRRADLCVSQNGGCFEQFL